MPDFLDQLLFRPEPIIAVQRFFGVGHPLPFRVFSLLGTTWGVLLATGLALALWGRRTMYALAVVMLLEVGASVLLNLVFHVDRPGAPGIVKYEHVPVSSFPSGHVMVAAMLWGMLYALGRVRLWLAALLVALTALGRIYLGVHYVADVVGGALLGAALVWALAKSWPRLQERLARVPFGVYGVLAALAFLGALVALTGAGSNAFRWGTLGVMAAAALALPLEYRYVGYEPGEPGTGEGARRAALLLAGLLPLLVVDMATGQEALRIDAAVTALATLWALLALPALLARREAAVSHPRREVSLRPLGTTLAVLLGGVALLFAYGTAIEPRLMLDVEEHDAPVPGLPPEWEGRRVAVLADFQVGMWWDNEGMARRAVREAIRRRPAVVLLAGDFIYKPDRSPGELVRQAVELVRPLAAAGIPTYAVLGNHDWGLNHRDGSRNAEAARMVRAALEEAGIPVLDNRAVPVGRGGSLHLVGIGSEWAGDDDVARALGGLPPEAPRIVFMHNPDTFREIPAGAAPLAVAGHTHGGQIAIPLLPRWSWLALAKKDEVHADGWIRGYGAPGNRLYVNRGIGFSTLPVRINTVPELTVFTLRRAGAVAPP